MRLPKNIEIVEVGPRDGLQSLNRFVPTKTKLEMIETLVAAGFRRIEVTSFVRPEIVPQLSDAESVCASLPVFENGLFRALVPNGKGARRAIAAGVTELVLLITASEIYNYLNQGMSIERNLNVLEEVVEIAKNNDVHLIGAISLAMFCAYEGVIDRRRTMSIIKRMVDLGLDELYVATSTGMDGPREVYELCSDILDRYPMLKLGVHLHNANGMALANALAAMDAGVHVLEGSICGMGGGIRLPDGEQDHGNVASEDLINLCLELGIDTGIELPKVLEASNRIAKLLDIQIRGFASHGGTKAAILRSAKLSPWSYGSHQAFSPVKTREDSDSAF